MVPSDQRFEMVHQRQQCLPIIEVLTVMLYDMCMYICVLAYHWPLTVHTSWRGTRSPQTERL